MRMPHRTQISDEQVLLFNQIKGDISKEIKGHKTEITQDPCGPTTLALSEKLQQTCKYPNQDRQAATLSEVESDVISEVQHYILLGRWPF